jgi:hypothetical protein
MLRRSKHRWLILALAPLLLLASLPAWMPTSSHNSRANFEKIRLGMKIDEAEVILGRPDYMGSLNGGLEHYSIYSDDDWSSIVPNDHISIIYGADEQVVTKTYVRARPKEFWDRIVFKAKKAVGYDR